MKDKIIKYLEDAGRPVFSKELERSFMISGEAVRDLVRQLRREGHFVVGSSRGYFIAKNIKEGELLIEDLESRAMSMLATVNKLKGHRDKLQKQQSLF